MEYSKRMEYANIKIKQKGKWVSALFCLHLHTCKKLLVLTSPPPNPHPLFRISLTKIACILSTCSPQPLRIYLYPKEGGQIKLQSSSVAEHARVLQLLSDAMEGTSVISKAARSPL